MRALRRFRRRRWPVLIACIAVAVPITVSGSGLASAGGRPRAASPIQPAGSLRFEMRIQVPADAPAEANGLFWELDPTGAQGPQAVSRLVVAR
jgi:hypothetical protein